MHEKFFQEARMNMIKSQILPNNVRNKVLIDSISNLKKELFVPQEFYDITYSDSDILITKERTLIRTFIMAKMFEYCNFNKNDTILVVGCLTGYSLAILSNLVSYVFGIENDKEIVTKANNNLNNLNILNCSVIYKKDLSIGLSKNAPFDKIFIEGAISEIPDVLIKQLKENGEIFTVINNDEYVGDFVRALKIDSSISIEKIFNTSINTIKDFAI
tara:strand:+ start:246 stop:893 length:648 start_codon:yes stop_codon:yes gene_type:complete